MTIPAGTTQYPDHSHWPTALASLLVGCAFFALWFSLLPGWLGFRVDIQDIAPWHWIAAVPSILGFAIALRCVFDFGWTGHGTPAPVAPPQHLVIVGFYRYVRNPMYIGFFTGWAGLWIIFGRINVTAITVTVIAMLAVFLFVIGYEEPTLQKKFGANYEEYCRNVHRWRPRLHPWNG